MTDFFNYSNLLAKSIIWFEFILDLAIKGTLILSIALIISFFKKQVSASSRHLVLGLAIISLLLLPFISSTLPTWELSFLSSVSTPKAELSKDTTDDTKSTTTFTATNDDIKLPIKIHWPVVLMCLWILGTLFTTVRLIIGLIGRWQIINRADLINDKNLQEQFLTYSKQMGISKNIRILQSADIKIPITWGYFRPTILLPETAKSWSETRKSIVLLHEFAHIKRGDAFTTLIAQITSILHWFNPLFWTVLRHFYIEREHASDNVVITAGTKASDYAQHLLEVAKTLTTMRWTSPVEVAMAQKSYLEGRLVSILNKNEHRNPLKKSTLILSAIIFLTFIVPVASIQPWVKNDIEQKQSLADSEIIMIIHGKYNKAFEAQDLESLKNFFSKKYFYSIDKNSKKAYEKWKREVYKTYFYKNKKTIIDSKAISLKKMSDGSYYLYETLTVTGIDKLGNKHHIIKDGQKTMLFSVCPETILFRHASFQLA